MIAINGQKYFLNKIILHLRHDINTERQETESKIIQNTKKKLIYIFLYSYNMNQYESAISKQAKQKHTQTQNICKVLPTHYLSTSPSLVQLEFYYF